MISFIDYSTEFQFSKCLHIYLERIIMNKTARFQRKFSTNIQQKEYYSFLNPVFPQIHIISRLTIKNYMHIKRNSLQRKNIHVIEIARYVGIYFRAKMQHFLGAWIFLFFNTIKGTKHLHESSHFCFREDYCQKVTYLHIHYTHRFA